MALDLSVGELLSPFNEVDTPGIIVSVITADSEAKQWAFGFGNLETRTPCTSNTNYRLASLSKQFTATAVLLLEERKQLSLNEPLLEFFPSFPAYGKNITVRHLLTHTSGIPDYEECIPAGTSLPVLDRDVLRILLNQSRTYFSPGEHFRYSNSGYALLAQIVEVRSGQTFARFLAEQIFRPLGMADTLAYEGGISTIQNRAFGYTQKGTEWVRTDQSLTSSVLGDGGIYSSADDLQRWDQALYGGSVLSLRLLEQAFHPSVVADRPATAYGFGWFIGSYRGLKEVWHYGETVGFTTRISRFPEKKFTVILLCNRNDAPLSALPHQLADRLLFDGR